MSEKIYYKILTSTRHSAVGALFSDLPVCLYYPVGVEVKPKLPRSKLFLSIQKEDAVRMAGVENLNSGKYLIVRCHATDVEQVVIPVAARVQDAISYWKYSHGAVPTEAPSTGVYWASSIICIE